MNWEFICVLPPLLAIALALIYKQVIPALLAGIFLGLISLHGFQLSIIPIFLDGYLIKTISDPDHLYVITFTFLIGGMVSIIQVNGGMNGIINYLSKYIKSKKGALRSTYILGLFIFFDDYANTLIVGNSMRNITDRFGISREKLAYLVDSTSAPLAAIAFISTWIGAELGYIQEALAYTNLDQSSYSLFLESLPYSFYPIFTLLFVGIIVSTDRDFGPMKRTKPHRSELKKTVKQGNSLLALLPIITLITVTIFGIIYTGIIEIASSGANPSIQEIIAHSNAYTALLWGASFSLFVATILSIISGMSFKKVFDSSILGFSTMFEAIIILICAWILSSVLQDLGTANYIGKHITTLIPITLLPALIFIIGALTSFSTGSSWGTMALLYPIALPVVWNSIELNDLCQSNDLHYLYMSIAAVLGGAVFGDHCSPISDTTILSSASSQCDHISHVKTQIPYALSTGAVSLAMYLISSYLLSPWYALGFGSIILVLLHRFIASK